MFFTPFCWNLESSLFSNCSQSLLKPCCIFSAEYNEERWFISRYEPLIHSNPLSVLVSGLFPEIYSYVPAILMWGGTTKPHSDAQEDSWRKILAYLQHHLYSSPSPKAKMWRRPHTEGAHRPLLDITLFDTGYFSLLYFLFPVSCLLCPGNCTYLTTLSVRKHLLTGQLMWGKNNGYIKTTNEQM